MDPSYSVLVGADNPDNCQADENKIDGAIVGGVVGGIAGAIIIGLVFAFLIYPKARVWMQTRRHTDVELEEVSFSPFSFLPLSRL